MSRRLLPIWGLFLVAVCVWRATSAENPRDKIPQQKHESGQAGTAASGDGFLTYISTDKPIYRPGETLYVRSIPLNAHTRQPVANGQDLLALVEIRGPKGDAVAAGRSQIQDGVSGFSWSIPAAQAGGEYKIQVSYPETGHPPAERRFDIRAYRAPRLKTQIRFLRDGYGAGDEVVASLHAVRAEGGVPTGATVTVLARIDGVDVFRGGVLINEQGSGVARFSLPKEIRRGEGTLAFVIEDGGVVETASKTIPILLQTVDLSVYPEGGELVAGLVNRVYFEAFTPSRKPADLAGVVLDSDDKEVATFRSEHEGRGRFTLKPGAGGRYRLKITEPSGIKTQYDLPPTQPSGVVLTSLQDELPGDIGVARPHVDAANVAAPSAMADIKVALAATEAGVYRVSVHQRDREVAMQQAELRVGEIRELGFATGAADGVLRVTVWNSAGKPLAERLVFRKTAHSIHVKLTADLNQYVPGGRAKITVKTCDETGQPISAVVGITATDESVLELIDKREQSPRLPVMVLLEGEVRELADAHVYLDPANPSAHTAVDLLLGTQGWRRFAYVDPARFAQTHGDAGRRVLALRVPVVATKPSDAFHPMSGGFHKKASGMPAAAPAFGNAIAPPDDAKHAVDELHRRKDEAPVADKADRDELLPHEELAKRGGFAVGGRRALALPHRNDFVPVRVYAHQVRSNRQPGDRADFAETLFWNAGIRTNELGEATVEFGLNDSVTSFRVTGEAFTDQGTLGAGSLAIESVAPFYLEPKLPLEVTTGDEIRLPLGVVNATNEALEQASVRYQMAISSHVQTGSVQFQLPANQRVRQTIPLQIGRDVGESRITLDATAGPHADKVTRTMMVRPPGFPTPVGFGGLLKPGETASHEFSIPKTLVPGSLDARLVVYPTPLASMNESLAALIREPSGCFEQTSSTVYPLVMAQQYFLSHQGVDPALIEKSSLILQTGYDRLRGFESRSGGFEWFGADPGHDALTAYGLLEFTDMSQVRFVDPDMLERTRKWLLDQRDSHGGYLRKTHTLHTWIADPECANAYNTWSLLEAGVKVDLGTEVRWIRDAAEKSQNSYAIALGANVLGLAGDKEGEDHLLDKLAGKQLSDGSVGGATTSVIGSGGDALVIETTALCVLAWLKNPSYASNVESSIKFLAESCKGGRFGSTQSTVLALKAIVAYDKSRAQPTVAGRLQLVVDGKPVGKPVPFDRQSTGTIELPKFSELLTPGRHQVQVTMTDGSQMPYSLAINYHNLTPASSDKCQLHLEVGLRDTQIEEGSATEATVVVVNRTNEVIPTPIAIVGIPGGLEVRHDQLKELVKSGKIAAYEVLGREVVLYWRSLDKEARVDLSLSLIGAVPGTYTGPASRAYLYYTDEHKQWVDGLKVQIDPK
jgi:hypothetical protein